MSPKNEQPRPVDSDALTDAIPYFTALGEQIVQEQLAMTPEQRKQIEDIANDIQAAFFKEAQGKYNGAVVIGAMFIVYKIVEQYRKDLGAPSGSTRIQ